jgi:hypothetical protein
MSFEYSSFLFIINVLTLKISSAAGNSYTRVMGSGVSSAHTNDASERNSVQSSPSKHKKGETKQKEHEFSYYRSQYLKNKESKGMSNEEVSFGFGWLMGDTRTAER